MHSRAYELEEVPEGQKSTYLQLLIQRIMKEAIQDGDQQMITRIWNYVDGMPRQAIEHSGKMTIFDILNDNSPNITDEDKE